MSGTRRRPGRMGPFIEGFSARLLEVGYTPPTVRNMLKDCPLIRVIATRNDGEGHSWPTRSGHVFGGLATESRTSKPQGLTR